MTDVGLQPSVEKASLEGDQRVVIANTDLLSPSGLAIDFTEERLFWCDQRRGVVESIALDGSDRRVLLGKQVGEACVTHTHARTYTQRHTHACYLKRLCYRQTDFFSSLECIFALLAF